jgi:prolyl-tRNA editing enzyme YbaK/EbsC (Cys-tRNA(Pro) deacylase)
MTAVGDQLLLEQYVLVEGGVTEEHLRLQLRNWRGFVAAVSAMCRRMEEDAED